MAPVQTGGHANIARTVWCRGYVCMRPGPKHCGNGKGIDSLCLPPGKFIPTAVQLAMMQPADGNGEPVADLASDGSRLCELDVVGV